MTGTIFPILWDRDDGFEYGDNPESRAKMLCKYHQSELGKKFEKEKDELVESLNNQHLNAVADIVANNYDWVVRIMILSQLMCAMSDQFDREVLADLVGMKALLVDFAEWQGWDYIEPNEAIMLEKTNVGHLEKKGTEEIWKNPHKKTLD